MREKRLLGRKIVTLLPILALAGMGLTACTADGPAAPTPETTAEKVMTVEAVPTVSTPEVTVEATPEAASKKQAVKQLKTPQGFDLPAGAYPQAGGPIPKDATEITSVHTGDGAQVATWKTPSGNIGCDLGQFDGEAVAGCGILQVKTAPKVQGPDGPDSPANWVEFSDPAGAYFEVLSDVAFFMVPEPEAQVVPYGQSVFFMDYACVSEKSGVTCWNVKSGHGTFMSREGLEIF
ncbi:hypothetical protein [Boudabousia marimammalium]|uniref:Lipoprotein n=1 Tax=Boudabousia marimammalium TaxID=156892 RepID=A0A1Q5PKG3_9ACTO|nr:hypothetical protein [Boudabousia marimammalium]OKL46702.1 hypothetical protein BM477_07045 [Boudabousia marimammalium]